MAELRKWTKKERLLRDVVESISEFVQNYEENRDKRSVDTRLKKLDDVYNEFCEVRLNIECITEEGDDDTETDEKPEDKRKLDEVNRKVMRDFVDQYFNLKNYLESFLSCPRASTSTAAPLTQQVLVSIMRVKLPELKLPIFGGSLMEWVTFRDTFQNLIVNNPHQSVSIDSHTYVLHWLEKRCSRLLP